MLAFCILSRIAGNQVAVAVLYWLWMAVMV